MNADYNDVNKILLRQYSEVLHQEIKTFDEYAEFSKNFKKLGMINSISEAKDMFLKLFNRNAEDGSFIVNESKITVETRNNTLRICLDSPKDYCSFIFFQK